MPIYTYECPACSHVTEKIFSVSDKPDNARCEKCGHAAKSIISINADRREWNSYWDDNLGDNPVNVESREHRRELMKKAGLQDQYHHKRGMPGQWV